MGQNNNILLIALMVVLILSMGVMMNLSILGYAVDTDNGSALLGNENTSLEVEQNNTTIVVETNVNNTTCGNGICDVTPEENCSTCPQDCGPCPSICGDGICDAAAGEDATTCPQDCQQTATDYTLLILGVSAGGVIGGILLVLYFFKYRPGPAVSTETVQDKEFIPGEDELVSYIRQMRSSGCPDSQIKAALLKAGWRTDVVDKVLAKYHK